MLIAVSGWMNHHQRQVIEYLREENRVMVLLQGVRLAIIGLAVGLAGAFAASRLLSKMLFSVKPNDPLTYGAVAGLMALATLTASYVPARRARGSTSRPSPRMS
jgi:hypothetical protein